MKQMHTDYMIIKEDALLLLAKSDRHSFDRMVQSANNYLSIGSIEYIADIKIITILLGHFLTTFVTTSYGILLLGRILGNLLGKFF